MAEASPANDVTPRPRWAALDGEARARRMTTEALRVWCLRRGIPIKEESNRRAFVQPEAIDAAVEALPVAVPNARARLRATTADDIDRELDKIDARR